jgi:hypothetical protein
MTDFEKIRQRREIIKQQIQALKAEDHDLGCAEETLRRLSHTEVAVRAPLAVAKG